MDTYMQLAMDIVTAQAKFRAMTESDVTTMVSGLTECIKVLDSKQTLSNADGIAENKPDAAKAVKERSITCLESGQEFKVITRKHLAKFGLTPEQYREKWGYAKNMPLVCKSLQRQRRKKMREMRLWERRGAVKAD